MSSNKVIFLGTGTSQGIPMIGCNCNVCRSSDPKDKRLRSSIYVEYEGLKLVVDAGPDYRQQMLREDLAYLDGILLTHKHIDHTGGLDDVRAFNFFFKGSLPIYCEENVYESLKNQFYYAFAEKKYPGAPSFDMHLINEEPFKIKGVEIIPIRAMHYKLPVLGFRFGNFAYLTDVKYLPESEFEKLKGLDYFVINTVCRPYHISHLSLPEAVDMCKKVGAKHSYLTHLSHALPRYKDLKKEVAPFNIEPAYDGLEIEF